MNIYEALVAKYGDYKSSYIRIPTGSINLNEAVGGGYPMGRIIEIFGGEGSGKTTLGLMALAEGQGLNMPVALIDPEYSLDINYAHAIGLRGKPNKDFGHLLPEYGEEAINMIIDAITNNIKVIVVDSVAAMIPKAELIGEVGEAHMGLQARMMGQAMRKLTGMVSRNKMLLIFINQVRSKIGVFFGSSEVTTGGRALKFYASIRIGIRAADADESGHVIKIKIFKNKTAVPFKVADLPLRYGLGVDIYEEFFEKMKEFGKIETHGSWYHCDDQKFLGKDSVIGYLRDMYPRNALIPLYRKELKKVERN